MKELDFSEMVVFPVLVCAYYYEPIRPPTVVAYISKITLNFFKRIKITDTSDKNKKTD